MLGRKIYRTVDATGNLVVPPLLFILVVGGAVYSCSVSGQARVEANRQHRVAELTAIRSALDREDCDWAYERIDAMSPLTSREWWSLYFDACGPGE